MMRSECEPSREVVLLLFRALVVDFARPTETGSGASVARRDEVGGTEIAKATELDSFRAWLDHVLPETEILTERLIGAWASL
jgi:hypothetical protein